VFHITLLEKWIRDDAKFQTVLYAWIKMCSLLLHIYRYLNSINNYYQLPPVLKNVTRSAIINTVIKCKNSDGQSYLVHREQSMRIRTSIVYNCTDHYAWSFLHLSSTHLSTHLCWLLHSTQFSLKITKHLCINATESNQMLRNLRFTVCLLVQSNEGRIPTDPE